MTITPFSSCSFSAGQQKLICQMAKDANRQRVGQGVACKQKPATCWQAHGQVEVYTLNYPGKATNYLLVTDNNNTRETTHIYSATAGSSGLVPEKINLPFTENYCQDFIQRYE